MLELLGVCSPGGRTLGGSTVGVGRHLWRSPVQPPPKAEAAEWGGECMLFLTGLICPVSD